MLWVLKRTVSMRWFFWAPTTYVKLLKILCYFRIGFSVTYYDHGFLPKACTFLQVSMSVFARNTTLGSTVNGSTSVLLQALVKLPLFILQCLPTHPSVFNLVVQRKRETVFVM